MAESIEFSKKVIEAVETKIEWYNSTADLRKLQTLSHLRKKPLRLDDQKVIDQAGPLQA